MPHGESGVRPWLSRSRGGCHTPIATVAIASATTLTHTYRSWKRSLWEWWRRSWAAAGTPCSCGTWRHFLLLLLFFVWQMTDLRSAGEIQGLTNDFLSSFSVNWPTLSGGGGGVDHLQGHLVVAVHGATSSFSCSSSGKWQTLVQPGKLKVWPMISSPLCQSALGGGGVDHLQSHLVIAVHGAISSFSCSSGERPTSVQPHTARKMKIWPMSSSPALQSPDQRSAAWRAHTHTHRHTERGNDCPPDGFFSCSSVTSPILGRQLPINTVGDTEAWTWHHNPSTSRSLTVHSLHRSPVFSVPRVDMISSMGHATESSSLFLV